MIKEVDYYLAEEGKPTYYILIFNQPKPPRPARPSQIFKADTWQEAQNFAKCFVSRTYLQYVEISALSPKIPSEEAEPTSLFYRRRNYAYETNKEEYWNEKGTIYYSSYTMPAPVMKRLTEKFTCPIETEQLKPAETPLSKGKMFPLGQLVMSRGVNEQVAKNTDFALFVTNSIKRHSTGDWGDLSAEDKRENDLAVKKGNLRIFSAYISDRFPKIWIITEADRSATNVLFPEEY